MKLQDCEKEIKDRHYLIGSEMEHQSGTHKIKIASLGAYPINGTAMYYICCHYYKQNDKAIM
ncbi:hypothetical protein [Flavobacterium psychrotrophum]|uniref:hypothetical protein n=1 Tax=Flavobacterium psychrotrophum TaxID=2294119 RepID=UPI000E31B1A4|nr:hypothetical protein [Flavobacterium psychrotrophum]